MCIMFVYINNNPSCEDYQLIIVNNRDEQYLRPTKPAAFWDHCNHCIGGLDLMHGRENGTWFGVSKHGKIGSLLNILTPYDPLPSKRGRGHLVTDYIQGSESASSYLDDVSESGALFNAFSLVLLEKEEQGDWNLQYYSNSDMNDKKIQKHADGIYGISNSVLDKPFKKVTYGKRRFGEIVKKYGRPAHQEQLLQELTNLMNDRTECLPDAQLSAQGEGYLNQELFTQRSCVYVDSSQIAYGTRTTSMLLVDRQNNCNFVERTMQEPIDASNPKWVSTSHTFSLSQRSVAKI